MLRSAVLPAALLLVSATALPARPGVRIDEDEVIFALEAPGAESVYLVGDFNAWNPTVDNMVEIDGSFEITLFLGAGTYEYRFVVDGVPTPDPGNPEVTPEGHSVLRLARVGGALELLPPEVVSSEEGGAPFRWSGWYRGLLEDRWEPDERNETSHLARGTLGLDLGGEAFFRLFTQWSRGANEENEVGDDVTFDAAEARVPLGGLSFTAFDNVPLPSPAGILPLYGAIGIYDYRFGYDVQGALLRGRLLGGPHLELLFGDRSGPTSAAPDPGFPYLGDWRAEGSAGRDTLYELGRRGSGGEDVWAARVEQDLGRVTLGLGYRHDRGGSPTTVVTHSWSDSVSTVTAARGHLEDRAWGLDLAWRGEEGASLEAGFQRGISRFRASELVSFSGPDSSLDLAAAKPVADGPDRDRDEGLRMAGRAAWGENLRLVLGFDYEEHEPRSTGGSRRPTKLRRRLQGGLDVPIAPRLRLGVRASWVSFGRSGDALFLFDPRDNFWLDPRGQLLSPDWWNLAGEKELVLLSPTLRWQGSAPDTVGAGRSGTWAALGGRAAWSGGEAVTLSWRITARRDLGRRVYAEGDGRFLAYRGGSLGLHEEYGVVYLETGMREPGRWEASVGFGVDPWAYEPVTSRYMDWGRDRFLETRGAVGSAGLEDFAGFGPRVHRALRDLESARLVKIEFRLLF
jgi:hypothetical protein